MAKPKLGVFKFASCDGCQLSLLDCEDELLTVAGAIQGIREQSKFLVTIGACATAGGIQALRNWKDVAEFTRYVYAHPDYISTLDTSTPVADHVPVDFELRGCPINKWQLVETVNAFLHGRKPNIPTYSVCVECKRRGTNCVMVSRGTPCLGPVTQAGCGALCPAYDRGCYGCFGPMESPNVMALSEFWRSMGVDDRALVSALRGFNAYAQPFREASDVYAQQA
jgi:sulfhydrogenase subunit delta